MKPSLIQGASYNVNIKFIWNRIASLQLALKNPATTTAHLNTHALLHNFLYVKKCMGLFKIFLTVYSSIAWGSVIRV